MNVRRVLVVEDERTIAESVAARLRAEGFAVDIAGDGPTAVESVRLNPPDLVVLDVMLPGFDGLEVCRRIQADRPVPVLMLTARDDETDLLVGLAVGADDYLTKPFSLRELAARVHALLRRVERAASTAQQVLRLGDLEINQAERRVRRAGVEAHLTPTEFDLLVHLAGRPRTVLPRERLLTDVWGWADSSGTRTVDSHIKALRRKLGADLIRTVHGVGYALEVRT
ncbi:response regulator transcription factor [Micromonospora sp. NPDC050417]|uniref:response regulator transcription factor n=1 Tax=Micromonospora sp. NPDC050417 TaxID=3364280 RepID=UPI0037A1BA75